MMCNNVGKWLGSRQIRCNWAAKGAGADEKQNSDVKSVVELTSGTSGEFIYSSALKFQIRLKMSPPSPRLCIYVTIVLALCIAPVPSTTCKFSY